MTNDMITTDLEEKFTRKVRTKEGVKECKQLHKRRL